MFFPIESVMKIKKVINKGNFINRYGKLKSGVTNMNDGSQIHHYSKVKTMTEFAHESKAHTHKI